MDIFYKIVCCVIIFQSNVIIGNEKVDSLKLLIKGEFDTTSIIILTEIGKEFLSVNKDSSIFYYEEALKSATELIHEYDEKSAEYMVLSEIIPKSYRLIGRNIRGKGYYDSARVYYNRGISTALKYHNKIENVNCLNSLGLSYYYQSIYDKAIEQFKLALNAADNLKDSNAISMCLNNIGGVYDRKGDYSSAIDYYFKSLVLDEQLNDIDGVAMSLSNIAILHYYQEKNKEALKYLKKALVYKEQIEDLSILSMIFHNLGLVYNDSKASFDTVLNFYLKSLQIEVQIGDLRNIGISYGNIANLYQDNLQFDKSLEYYEKCLKVNNEINYLNGKLQALSGLSELYRFWSDSLVVVNNKVLSKSYLLKSIDYAHDVYILAQTADQPKDIKTAVSLLHLGYKNLGAYEKALNYAEELIRVNEDIYSQDKLEVTTEITTKYETNKKEQEIITLQKDNEIQTQRVLAQRRLSFLIGLGAILLFVLSYVYYRWNKTKQKNKQNELTIKNLLTEQKMLRGQMNPHFIYNSLNSIQAFISSDESYQAEKYLAQFARLMRGILENSRADFVVIEKEVEVLQLYLELEQLRFENRFTFEINFDDNLETEFLSIPPMLIQPFVENAILHGFTNRTHGKITISLAEKEDLIVCLVDDNGIGREAAVEHKKVGKYQSLATKITEERLETLSSQMNVDAGFKIEDKKDIKGNPIGTCVHLKIPFVEI